VGGGALPAPDAPAPVAVGEPAPPPPVVATGGGLGIIPLIAGLAVLGGLAALLLSKDKDNDQIAISPA